jgi:hypothetical protein
MSESKSQPTGNQLSSDKVYHAVLVPDDDNPFLVSYSTVTELQDALRKFVGTTTRAFPFVGQPWSISKGPTRRHLLDPSGNRYPLFKEESLEVDPTGSLNTKEASVSDRLRP